MRKMREKPGAATPPKTEENTHFPYPRAKRPRIIIRDNPNEADLEHDGFTSTDSYSRDRVMEVDWRLSQVKHRKQSTNTLVTQYWHYVDKIADNAEENMFEHQVLKDMSHNRVSWGVYKDPIDFHLRLTELKEVMYANDNLRIIISTREVEGVDHRGDVLAEFRRERTKRRFLKFIRSKGVRLVKTTT